MPRAGAIRAFRVAIVALALFFAPGAMRFAAAQLPAGMEEGIYELRLADLPPISLPVLVRPEGTVFVPLRPVLELAGAPFRLLPDSGAAILARPRGQGEVRLDVAARTLVGLRRVELADGEAFVAQGDVYLAATRLGDLLEAAVELDPATLTLTVTRELPFPAQERESNRARRAGAPAGAPVEAALARRIPFVPRSGGGVVEWGITSSLPEPWTPSAVDARVGVGILGGLARVGASGQSGEGGVTLNDLNASYQRVFPNGRWVRQFQVGDLATGGPRPRSVRGFSVGNAPFTRDALYGEVRYAPQLPSGWEYEVYQNGRLLGFSGDASAGGVAIPVAYGNTPVEVRMYGPAGERVQSEISYLVPAVQLPRGRTEYSLGGGRCAARTDCRLFGYLDLRRGVAQGLTVFAGVEAPVDSVGADPRPYGGASFLPARGWAMELQAMMSSYLYGTVEKVGNGALSGSASAGVTYPERRAETVVVTDGSPGVPVAGASWYATASLGIRTGGLDRLVRTVSLTARANGSQQTGERFVQLSAATALRRVLLETGYETSPASPGVAVLRVGLPLMGVFPRWLQVPTVYAGAGVAGGLQRWDVTATAQPFRTQLSATARWFVGNKGPSISIGAGIPLRFGRAQSLAGVRDGVATGSMTLSGAAAFGSGSGVSSLRYGGLGLSGVRGEVFLDANGNGVRDAGEQAAANAAVDVGSTRIRTDSSGHYATWSIVPYEVARVRLDTTTLADPGWVPARAEELLRPSPHMYSAIHFPLVQTRELAGLLVAGGDVRSVAGVTVEIVAPDGEVVKTLSFSDGAFYVGRLAPGNYEVRVSESSLRALGARSDPASVRVNVPASGDRPLVELAPFRLRRAR